MEQGRDHDADARRQPRMAHRQGAQQGRQNEGDLGGEAGIVGTGAPVGKAGERRDTGDDRRQQHLATDRVTGRTGQRDDRKGADAGRGGRGPVALAPLAIGSDQQSDSKGDREAHQA